MKMPTTAEWHAALSAELTHRPELTPGLAAIVEATDLLTRTAARDGQILLAGNRRKRRRRRALGGRAA